ncbi:RNA polymerase sigma factor [Alkaliphilus peptidifermentans]|uniref:RNA polymerase sigma-70 factor, ECF subfamily n=1 Tax=Alkaliphilus peptidifermentans DSM 18978 TaxID=1120976 RepID=A0A1G5IR53_9FIRM|nr:RNA polymerase sigma factor [Alkaliphilus peptidifermentans]SCY78457.1 RNA polymerase sigma-70 factor, ECF subfamily [Alkaliphilus peptidifermentans DSM 18978]
MSLDIKDQYDKIHKYCYFKTKNCQLAEDLTQETFLKYFSQTSYIDRGKPLAYLYTIAKNLCIDTLKKPKIEALGEDTTTTDELTSIEISFVVRQAMDTLPKDLAEIVMLRVINELSMAEVCSITQLSRFVVYRKLKAALKQLKLILREEDLLE